MSFYNPDQYTEPQSGLEPPREASVIIRIAVHVRANVPFTGSEADDIIDSIDRLLEGLPHREKLAVIHE